MEKQKNLRVDLFDDNIGFIELVDYMGSDLTVVNSARVSFGSHKEELDDKDKKLIGYLIKHKHTSTLEHNIATFRMKVPLFIRSQHHRHRTWSYNEISRRYTDFNIEFYMPESFRSQSKSNRQASTEETLNPVLNGLGWGARSLASDLYKEICQESLEVYNRMLESGICKEQARGILPQSMYTEYYATANLNNILKFVDLRIHEGAQWEIQNLAKGMLYIIKELWPISIEKYNESKQ